jgi:hypothetical protein
LLVPRVTQPAAHLETVDTGQHQVEHDQVGSPLLGERQRGQAVRRVPGFHARVPEIVGHDLSDGRIVVDHENAGTHRPSVGTAVSS